MTNRILAASAFLLTCLHASAAPDAGLNLALEIDRDGQRIVTSTMSQPSGTAGQVLLKNEFRLKITPTLVGDKADVKFEIFTTQDGIESAARSPRIITKLGESASLAWTTSNGENYRLSVLVSETSRPIQ